MKDKVESEGLGVLVLLALTPVLVPLNAFVSTFVFLRLWDWFAIPILHFPMLTFWQAMGLQLLVGFLTHQHRPSDKKAIEFLVDWLLTIVVGNGFTLLFGFIVHEML